MKNVFFLALLVGCSGQVDPGASETGPRPAKDGAVSETSCGATGFELEAVQPNMLILFDRSCSMRRRFDLATQFGAGPTDPGTRWFVGRRAVDEMTKAFAARIRFGLMVFPRPAKGCGDAPVVNVPFELINRTKILSALDAKDVQPFSLCTPPESSTPGPQPHVTPTSEALAAAGAAFVDRQGPNYILLITDGHATCNATAQSLGAQAAALLAKGIRTAVVGFGDVGSPVATTMLDAVANAGGAPKSGKTAFWLASSSAELKQALATIVGEAVSCSFKLKQTPPDPTKLFAFFDGKQVDAGAWTYDAKTNSVTFTGEACQRLKKGVVMNVSLVFGCPDPACVPSKEVCDAFDNDCDGEVDEGCLE
jgi:hypothetical protein